MDLAHQSILVNLCIVFSINVLTLLSCPHPILWMSLDSWKLFWGILANTLDLGFLLFYMYMVIFVLLKLVVYTHKCNTVKR